MNDLSALKDKLDALDNELGASLAEAEQALAHLGLGVPIQLKLDEESNLFYRKHNKTWRLVLEREHVTTMLCDAPRELRALALQKLPDLLVAAAVQMREMIAQRKETLAQTIEAAFEQAMADARADLMRIVEAVGRIDNPGQSMSINCKFCGSGDSVVDDGEVADQHEEDCAWVLARELVGKAT